MTKNILPNRLLCRVSSQMNPSTHKNQYAKLSEKFNGYTWQSFTQIRQQWENTQKEGRNTEILPKKNDLVLGNLYHEGSHTYIPLCQVLIPEKITPEFLSKYECLPLTSSRAKEYDRAWMQLGCPFTIDTTKMHDVMPETPADLLSFRTSNLPAYDTFIEHVTNGVQYPLPKAKKNG